MEGRKELSFHSCINAIPLRFSYGLSVGYQAGTLLHWLAQCLSYRELALVRAGGIKGSTTRDATENEATKWANWPSGLDEGRIAQYLAVRKDRLRRNSIEFVAVEICKNVIGVLYPP